tara:strand:+ start:3132 stop:3512 length:381 start_codon:yes stop_codon:yes gene_type:complete
MATNENWTDKNGNRQERTEWHSVTVWGKQAEICGQYLAKGREVYVEGRLQSRQYTDREGAARTAWEVVANNVVFIGGRGDNPDGQNQSRGNWQNNQQQQNRGNWQNNQQQQNRGNQQQNGGGGYFN